MTETSSEPLLLLGDCLDRLREMPDNSVDSVVTDPPYGLSFMGKKWDYDVPSEEIWRECLRVLKPGGHLLAFAGTRTQHRMAVRIEDAGFEIRDMIAWVYASGFPKSLDVSKAIDKASGFEGRVVGRATSWNKPDSVEGNTARMNVSPGEYDIKELSPTAKQWQGWGTALKPALEPITVARKPLGEKTVAANVLAHGTGGINVDGCRVPHDDSVNIEAVQRQSVDSAGGWGMCRTAIAKGEIPMYKPGGRWPANLIHDGSDEVVGLFPVTDKAAIPRNGGFRNNNAQRGTVDFKSGCKPTLPVVRGDSGSAARFFYVPKASKKDRDEGCEGLDQREKHTRNSYGDQSDFDCPDGARRQGNKGTSIARNHHPTVKPTALMRYLCRLVTPPEGIVLDPFMGSGSTGKAAMLEGFHFIGIERDEEYMEIAKARISAASNEHA